MPYPVIDPVAFSMGPIAIHWYGIAYVVGILGWWKYSMGLARKTGTLDPRLIDDFIPWAVVGIVLGGRLGHVLFYGLPYYSAHPLEIIMVWKGGMSFHGAVLGVTLAIFFYARRHKISPFTFSDVAMVGIPIGLFFGRIANFINGELYGRVSDVPWAMVFPRGGDFPRHPSQLYEALGEGILLFLILMIFALPLGWIKRRGALTGVFLLGYGLIRFIIEFYREPETSTFGSMLDLSAGQLFSIPLMLVGFLLIILGFRRKNYDNAL